MSAPIATPPASPKVPASPIAMAEAVADHTCKFLHRKRVYDLKQLMAELEADYTNMMLIKTIEASFMATVAQQKEAKGLNL